MRKEILSTNLQKEKADFILNNTDCKLSKLKGSQLQDIAIQWSYYSGKIEGSTFTLVQTESLIKDDFIKGRFEDAIMHKNMYNVLMQEMDYIKNIANEVVDDKLIYRVHKGLTKGLISDEDSGMLRKTAVGVKGTHYIPSKDPMEIHRDFSSILFEQQNYEGIEKAVFLHCNLARLQGFIDGNKRTARMAESVVLMNNDLLPTFTINQDSFLEYREAMVEYYESEDYSAYVDFMLDKQIEVIEQLSTVQFRKRGFRR